MTAAPVTAPPVAPVSPATEPPVRPVRFWHRGRVVTVDGAHPTRSVLDWLREDARRTGTKEGCNEGDCGACTVVVGELAEDAEACGTASARESIVGGLSLRTVNACLRFLPTLDGRALFTVEDVAGITGGRPSQAPAGSTPVSIPLHPVQQALVDHHGSQCGFCTPGFVMSMWSLYEQRREAGTRPDRRACADALAGNLCRCTGYRPILDAAQAMFDAPPVRLDTAPVVAALRALRDADGGRGFTVSAPNPHRPDAAGRPRNDRLFAPRTLDAFAALRAAHPQARLLAGATDVGLWVTKQFRDLGDILWLGDVAELRRIVREPAGDGTALEIGAGASLEDAWTALVAEFPSLRDVWLRFASPPVRHAGTLGGNVANGSPIGDAAPILMALDAAVVLRHGDATRILPLADFYTGYMTSAMRPGEFVQALRVPLPAPQAVPAWRLRAYKVSKRFDSDISAVCAGLALALDDDGRVAAARFAFGGMAATVARARSAEAAVVGQPWTEATAAAAGDALATDFTPMTDLRASAGYRRRVAANLLQRLWLETRPDAPLPAAALNVYDDDAASACVAIATGAAR